MSEEQKKPLKEQLQARIKDLEAELKKVKKQKKYGLVWEDKPEQIVEDCKRNVPILRLKEKKKGVDPVVITDELKDENILIEGDNYHALSVLNYTHKGKIDVIYIDPPYNTGNNSWRYNNDYVDKDDDYRHSKWLSLMYIRLKLARGLLSKNGSLICAIDENELNTLGLMLQEIFYGYAIDCITVIHNPGGIQGTNFSYNHEYVYFVYPKQSGYIGPEKRSGDDLTPFRDWGKENSKREGSPNCFYPIISDGDKIIGFGEIPLNSFHPKSSNEKRKDCIYIWPVDANGVERRWRFARDTVESIAEELVVKKQGDQYSILRGKINYIRKTVWNDDKFNANIYGTQLLSQILPDKFPFPKSLHLVKECLVAVEQNKNAVILDFFAGSGTTGHAVLDLNKQDGGNRKFILCTNNENNICEEVTYERVKRVMKGYKNKKSEKIEGLGGNLRYYKTNLVDIEKLHNTPDHAKIKLTYQAGEMIGLRENTLNEVEKNEWWQIFEGQGKTTAIYFKEDKEKLRDLVAILEKKKQPTTLYIFSWGKNEYNSEYNSENIKVEDIPEPILEVYKEINRL
jgi:adenine-specific DNA-methyltransferase